ncbi:MAG: hypothetical protein ACOC22_02050 [bacterium]
MSLVDNKRGVVNSIGAYNSMLQEPDMPDSADSLPSINNDDDAVPFLLDIIKVIAGSERIKRLTGELLTNFLDESEPVMKESLINQGIQEGSNETIPAYFRPSGTGINVPVEQIDLFGKLKTDPSSDIGSLLFDNNSNTLDKAAYDAIATGNEITYNNLNIKYNNDDTFTLKSNTENVNIGDWINNFVSDTELINKREFIVDIIDSIYGTVTSGLDKSEEEIFEELKITKTFENAINGSGLGLDNNDIIDLRNRANEMKNGVVNLDLGCGLFSSKLTTERLGDFLDTISGSSDPNQIANELDGLIDDTIDDEDVLDENEGAIEDGFFKLLIRRVQLIFIKALIATPFGRIFQGIISAFKNGGSPTLSIDFQQDIENFRTLIQCIIFKLKEELNRFIYVLAVSLLVALLKPVIRKITKERINNWIRIIKSLLI